jgi:hypothetical protein
MSIPLQSGAAHPAKWDNLALGLALAALLGIVTLNLIGSPVLKPAAPHVPWCAPGQLPAFQFGFAELSRTLGSLMGEPTECEHGVEFTSDTRQATSTGIAEYDWCTNTPSFTSGQEHWRLTQLGVEHWQDEGEPPRPLPIVRAPDLRRPCVA